MITAQAPPNWVANYREADDGAPFELLAIAIDPGTRVA
jgi:hypothetical protein